MKLPLRATLASIAVGSLLAIGSIGPAYAAQATTPLTPEVNSTVGVRPCAVAWTAARDNGAASLRKLGDCEIDRRLDTITKLQSRVADSSVLTSADRAALQSRFTADTSGLTALRATIDGETDVNALRADLRTIVTGYRIYLLVVPMTADVIAADTELAAVARLGTLDTKLQARIDAAKSAGKDVTQAQSELDAMQAKVAAVTPLVQGIPAAVLPLTPAQYNDGTAKPVLTSSRAGLRSGHGLLVGARSDAAACIAALKAL